MWSWFRKFHLQNIGFSNQMLAFLICSKIINIDSMQNQASPKSNWWKPVQSSVQMLKSKSNNQKKCQKLTYANFFRKKRNSTPSKDKAWTNKPFVQSLQLCLNLSDPMDCSLWASSVPGIFQARILGWLSSSPPGNLPNPGIEPTSPAL